MHKVPAHKPRKRFGQHFLSDQTIIEQIINIINPQKRDHIIEIGPGKGALTDEIKKKNPVNITNKKCIRSANSQ